MGGACSSREDDKEVKDTRTSDAFPYATPREKGSSTSSSSSGWYTGTDVESLAWKRVLKTQKDSSMSRRRPDALNGHAGDAPAAADDAIEPSQKDQHDGFDWDAWLDMAEQGELDIYTCLGLSDASNLDEGTKKLLGKITGVLVLQLVVPILMLYLQLTAGITIRPRNPELQFRFVGCTLYLYSLYSMYNNALDECRSKLLKFVLDNKLTVGYWFPLALGEFSNTMVSLVLVFTLFFIYTNATNAMDLILNAVAVNFLGGVDAEMVNSEMLKQGVGDFKVIMSKFRGDKSLVTGTVAGIVAEKVLHFMLYTIAFSGCTLAFLFLVVPSADPGDFVPE